MFNRLFDSFIVKFFLTPIRTIYVISDSQLDEIRRTQRQGELDNLEVSRKRLEETYEPRIKIIAQREQELQDKLSKLEPRGKGHRVEV